MWFSSVEQGGRETKLVREVWTEGVIETGRQSGREIVTGGVDVVFNCG